MFYTKKKENKYIQEIANLKHEITELSNIVKTQELLKLREENLRLKEKCALIDNVRFSLKSVAYLIEEDKILVKYEIPNVLLSLDAEKNIIKNNFFYSINKLQLLPFEDMKKIQKVIDDVKKLK